MAQNAIQVSMQIDDNGPTYYDVVGKPDGTMQILRTSREIGTGKWGKNGIDGDITWHEELGKPRAHAIEDLKKQFSERVKEHDAEPLERRDNGNRDGSRARSSGSTSNTAPSGDVSRSAVTPNQPNTPSTRPGARRSSSDHE